MTDPSEPENGSHVLVWKDSGVRAFTREDDLALAGRSQFRWMRITETGLDNRNPRSWAEVCALGPVAYVGEFVNRSPTQS